MSALHRRELLLVELYPVVILDILDLALLLLGVQPTVRRLQLHCTLRDVEHIVVLAQVLLELFAQVLFFLIWGVAIIVGCELS